MRPVLIISAGWDDCLVEGKGGKNEKERPHLLTLINVNANDSHRFLISPLFASLPLFIMTLSLYFHNLRELFIYYLLHWEKTQFLMRLCKLTLPPFLVILVSDWRKPTNQRLAQWKTSFWLWTDKHFVIMVVI